MSARRRDTVLAVTSASSSRVKRKAVASWQARYAAMGATMFCRECFAWVYPTHTMHWATAEFNPTQAKLEGGLTSEENAT